MSRKFEPTALNAYAVDPRAIGMAFDAPSNSDERHGDVAVINIRGPLDHHAGCYESYDSIGARVKAALSDASVRRVVMSIDSPGGMVSGCFDTVREIRTAVEASGKPLDVYVDGLAASAGYALACCGDRIFAPSTGCVGSIGVIQTLYDVSQANAAMGVQVSLITSGSRKADGHPEIPLSDSARAAIQREVDYLANEFASLVAARRGMSVDAVLAMQAGVLIGAEAVGTLIDAVATLDQVLALDTSAPVAAPEEPQKEEPEEMSYKAMLAKILTAAKAGDEEARAALAAAAESEPEEEPEEEPKSEEEPKEEPKEEPEEEPKSEEPKEEPKKAVSPVRAARAALKAAPARMSAEDSKPAAQDTGFDSDGLYSSAKLAQLMGNTPLPPAVVRNGNEVVFNAFFSKGKK